jgi:hypothetical protein
VGDIAAGIFGGSVGAATDVIVVVVACEDSEEGTFVNLEEVAMVVGSPSLPVGGGAVTSTGVTPATVDNKGSGHCRDQCLACLWIGKGGREENGAGSHKWHLVVPWLLVGNKQS